MSTENLARTAYCGLYCGGCAAGKGTTADKAEALLEELEEARFAQVADIIPVPEFKKYPEFNALLSILANMKCVGCRGGTRSESCNIAKCCIEKGYEGCWICADFRSCEQLDWLGHVHGDAHLVNLAFIADTGVDEWVASGPPWYHDPDEKA